MMKLILILVVLAKKVQKNKFGACLIKEPDLVAECINSMINACKIPVTAKTRIGFDDTEDLII